MSASFYPNYAKSYPFACNLKRHIKRAYLRKTLSVNCDEKGCETNHAGKISGEYT